MRLKKLEILGFKSFADKIKLDFDPGITAVVGPNGCGKSNIADAFRWVLGEQSAKSMRGGKMQDVIFAGTTHRKALNFAEVTITLHEIDGKLPIDYDEVAVTRRLHRSGESEYFINKHPTRLKDVQTLFLDSGMGKDSYSIFEQGKIDEVINLSPLERRYIFEEAAGILRFLQRKKEALRKLEQTDLNVSRVKDIHKEVERQIIVLEEQSEKARQYKENKSNLDKLERLLLLSKWEGFQLKLQDFKAKTTKQTQQIVESNSQIEAFQDELLKAKSALDEANEAMKISRENMFNVRSHKELQSKEKQTNQERLKDLIAKEKRWQGEIESLEERKLNRDKERKNLKSLQKELNKRFEELEKVVIDRREKVRILEEELVKQREQQQSKQKDLFKLMQAESLCESEIRQINVRLESSQERQGRIFERKERLSQASVELLKQAEDKKNLLQQTVAETEKQKEYFASMEVNLQEIAKEMHKTQEEMDKVYLEFSDFKARQKSLQRLREDMEGFSSGSKKLLQESVDKKSPLFGKIKGLYEFLVPEKGSEAALANVMKYYSQTLVIDSETDFELVIEYVKKYNLKDISLLCLKSISKQKKNISLEKNQELSPLTLTVIESELTSHFLDDVFLSKKSFNLLEAARFNHGIEICLNDGVFIDRRSVIFFSSHGENNVFMREAELKALEKKILKAEHEKQQLENVLRAIQVKRSHLQTERAELDKTIRRAEMKIVEYNFSVQKSSTDLEKMSAEDKMLATDWHTVNSSIETLKHSLTELNERHKKAKELSAEMQKETDKLTFDLTKYSENVKVKLGNLRSDENVLQNIVDEQRKNSHALHVLEVKDLESVQQESRLLEEINLGKGLQTQIELKRSDTDKVLKEVEQALSESEIYCQEQEKNLAARKKGLEYLEIKIQDKRQALKRLENEHTQASIQSAQVESNGASIESELNERHRMSVQEAKNLGGKEVTQETLEKQMKEIRQMIENAGDINMTSIEECEKYKTRYEFLNQQIDDLGLSKEELIAIIADLDAESRKIFQETFQKVRVNFKKNFEILFNGGEADLQFTESEDILEAGIEIIAKPPGKQMRSINLLSGGEKCLTAMALLFAIFEVKPAPFCILDEIDAPLDDTNVERFVNLVKQFVVNCQFIIITHNKSTMAIADIIRGVSMEEKGVSKVISIDFSKNESPEMASI